MTKLFLLVCLSVPLISCGQQNTGIKSGLPVNQDSVVYIRKCIAFIQEIQPQELSDTNFILSDKPFLFEYFDCMENVLADAVTFTKEELSYIKDKKYPSLKKWTEGLLGKIKLVSSDSINAIFRDNKKEWRYFYKNFGASFNNFSVPIFLRNDTYCLFYSDNHCGGLCGGGSLVLYKKENNRWTKVHSYCDWIS